MEFVCLQSNNFQCMLQDANFHVDTRISGILLYVIFLYLQVSKDP